MTEKNWKELYEKALVRVEDLIRGHNSLLAQRVQNLEKINALTIERDALKAIVNNPDAAQAKFRHNHEILQRALDVILHTAHVALARQDPPR